MFTPVLGRAQGTSLPYSRRQEFDCSIKFTGHAWFFFGALAELSLFAVSVVFHALACARMDGLSTMVTSSYFATLVAAQTRMSISGLERERGEKKKK
jgi:hypothetical protein